MREVRDERGQALVVLVVLLMAAVVGTFIIGAVATGIGSGGRNQRAADLAALAGGRAMEQDFDGLFAQPDAPGAISKQQYVAHATEAALEVAERNEIPRRYVKISFPGHAIAPTRIRVAVSVPVDIEVNGERERTVVPASAEAELEPSSQAPLPDVSSAGEYPGPFAHRQGKPMRPDVAQAFDRMYDAARSDGISLIISSAFRSNAEQAVLFAQHPDPKWVARPGTSLHRMGTELDLGPPSALGWVAANAKRFHFIKRYSWEEWHFGYTLNAPSSYIAKREDGDKRHGDRSAMPSFVPTKYASIISRAAQHWNVSAALLAAQLYQESHFNEHVVSPAGAQGIAQFMPGTAADYNVNTRDPSSSIDGQAHYMRDLLRQFGQVDLALAAYNAGPGRVSACHCVPNIPETKDYVTEILGRLRGAGEIGLTGGDVVSVRLVE